MAKLLCMEVGTSTVRLAEVVKRGKSIEVTKTFVFDTPDDATKDGKVRVSDVVVSAIRDGIDESGIKATDVYFVVESTKILFKQVEIQKVPNRQIQTTLELSFTDHFPVDETLYHVSYVKEKEYEKNGQKWLALDVFAIPNDLSESYYNLAVSLGLNAKGLTDPSRSLISLFPDLFKNRNVAMVNINESVSTLTISVDGDMIFNKTIPYGVYSTLRQVMNSPLTLDTLDVTGASELLYTRNILMKQMPDGILNEDDEEEKLRYAATTSIMSLVKAIEATFTAVLSKENIQIQEFHLSGLGAGFAGISQLLTYEFGIPVTVVQQEGNLKVNPLAADDTILLSCYPCVGAALDAANFFTEMEKAGGEIAKRKQIDRMFIFVGALVCVASFGFGSWKWLDANLRKQDVYDENVRLTRRVQELRDLGVEIAYNDYMTALSYNEEVNVLYDETCSGNEDMTTFLAELELLLPKTAKVSAMTLTPGSANVSFLCDNKFVAAGVLHLLRNMDTIHSMDCPGVSELENSDIIAFNASFSLKSTADRKAEKEAAEEAAKQEAIENGTYVEESVEENIEETEETSDVNTETETSASETETQTATESSEVESSTTDESASQAIEESSQLTEEPTENTETSEAVSSETSEEGDDM